MKHKIGYNRLGRKSAHRKALLNNMSTSLFRYERIRTTSAKAKELRKLAERMITRAKIDSVHNRRIIARSIGDKAILAKLFTDIGPRYVSRPGGYTRILSIGNRQGDAAPMVIIELVGDGNGAERKQTKPKRPRRAKNEMVASDSASQVATNVSESKTGTEEEVDAATLDEPSDSESGRSEETK